jgi:hypothetical protein
LKKSKKTLDKPKILWYNIDVKREEKEKSKVCAEKNFSEMPKKDLTNSELYDIIKLQKDSRSPKNGERKPL